MKHFLCFFVSLVLGAISVGILSSTAPSEASGQLLFLCLGGLIFLVINLLPQNLITLFIPIGGMVTFLLLLLTLAVGFASHGAVRWLPLGVAHLQISEFAKPMLALLLGAYVKRFSLRTQRRILGYFILSALFILPVFLQPDLGSSLVLMVESGIILFLALKNFWALLPWGLVFLFIAWFGFTYILRPYQKDRLASFVSGQGDATYNATQAYITVGSGKWWGRGLGHGVQTKLKFLPEYHTDFFFASIAEELGFVGVACILGLYIFLYYNLLSLIKTPFTLAFYFTSGFVGAVFFQMCIHMGMNMQLFPITGIPLPLLSSGGSSFLATCSGIALISRLNRTT